MLKFLNIDPEVSGLDINDRTIKIVKLQKRRGGFELAAFGKAALREGVVKEGVIQDAAALAQSVSRAFQNICGSQTGPLYAAVALPEEKSFSQIIQMPVMPEADLRSAVFFEAENYIPLAMDKVYFDFQKIDVHDKPAEDSARHVDLLINVMPKTIIDAYVSCLKDAGIIPWVLEVESQAIVRSLVKEGVSLDPIMAVDIGQTKTSIIIFAKNCIRFTVSLPISSAQLTQAIVNSLQVTATKAESLKVKHGLLTGQKKNPIGSIIKPMVRNLAEQIKKYMNFYHGHNFHESSQDYAIKKVVLAGGGANLLGLPEFLEKEIDMPVEVGNPLINITPSAKRGSAAILPDEVLSFTTAIGLALRGANAES